ncbi:flavin monoamine oxidase family protein [Salinarimonas soli]|uniref:Tryptophan 2-monooxygenase n=1 Tax=Salinarimonas soli TaxID=1638099 RepID=A0A5B2VSM0_9HYPH|nr:NAD(P)/FAD-dependent oxidoreductase [Salinarimonas soli]KAA2241079.1 FAD-dependent oxidoreductase [Salinarimonas soli]
MQVTRRSIVLGAAAVAAVRPSVAASDVDVAVIGAGAAGIAAAQELTRSGRSVMVLEARDRVGGRAHTDTSLGIPFDAGALYIHWGERNPWRKIAEELKVPLEPDGWGEVPLVFRNGQRLSESERARRRGGFGWVWSAIEQAGEDRSFVDAVRNAPQEVLDAAAGLTLFSLGEDPQRVSVADYQELWSGDDYLVPSGYGALVARAGQGLPVRLGTPVTAIRWDGPAVEIETATGILKAGAVVVTVPVGVLKAEGIRFTPDLPSATRDALDGLGMGAYTKIALRIDRKRIEPLESTSYFEIGDNGAVTSYDFWPFERDLMIALLGGDHGRAVCEAGEREAVAFATDRLAAMVGERARKAVTGGRLAAWWTDPYAHGSYSIVKPGRLAAREALRQPVGGRIHFAGEATAGGGAMTVGGATLEGIRAAQTIIRGKSG